MNEYDDLKKELDEIKQLALNNSNSIKENKDDITKNFDKIQENAYGLEILKDYKKTSQRLYIIVLLLLIAIIVLGLHHFFNC